MQYEELIERLQQDYELEKDIIEFYLEKILKLIKDYGITTQDEEDISLCLEKCCSAESSNVFERERLINGLKELSAEERYELLENSLVDRDTIIFKAFSSVFRNYLENLDMFMESELDEPIRK